MKTQMIKINTIKMLACAILAAAAISPVCAEEHKTGAQILPPESRPFGETYGEWAQDWWTWALSIPSEINPLSDTTGADAGVGQHGPVWFLAGATGNGAISAARTVTVPGGKALFFPVINTLWTTGPSDPPTTVPDILSALAGVTADLTDLTLVIDGVPVKHLEKFTTVSPVFSLTVPADNVLGLAPAVYTPDIDEGIYVMIAPLKAGAHTIHFTSNSPDLGYSLDITYNLTVLPSVHGDQDGD